MAIKTDILGMVHEYPDYFVIGREKIRKYAAAIKAEDPAHYDEAAAAELGHDSLVAPPTFISTLALLMQRDFFRKVDTGFQTMQIVQVDQKFHYHKRCWPATRCGVGWRSFPSTNGSARTSS